MRPIHRFAAAFALVLLGDAFLAVCEPSYAQDTRTPKSAAAAYLTALQRGDAAALRTLVVGTSAEVTMLEVMMNVRKAATQLKTVWVNQFGAASKLPDALEMALNAQGSPGSNHLDLQLDSMIESDDGDKAVFRKKSPPNDPNVIRLVKKGNDWKVDLTCRSERLADPPT